MGILSGVPDFFGLDIGTTAVRVVQLKGKGANKSVFRYGKIPVDQSIVGRSDVNSLAKLANTIRELLVQSQITTRNVVMGLPTRKIYSVTREFDPLSASDLAKTINFQIERIVPGYQDSKVDWAVLDAHEKEVEKREVFICAAPNGFIQERLELLESINLNVLAFEPDSLALVRAMASAKAEQASLIIDIGFNDTDIIVIHKNQPRLITSVATGLSNIIKSIIDLTQTDQAHAQQSVFQIGMRDHPSQQGLKSTIAQAIDIVLIQVRKSIDFFVSRYPGNTLAQLTLCGDAAYIPGLAEFISGQTGMQVAIGDAWQNVVCPQEIHDDLKNLAVSFPVVAGLAERQVI